MDALLLPSGSQEAPDSQALLHDLQNEPIESVEAAVETPQLAAEPQVPQLTTALPPVEEQSKSPTPSVPRQALETNETETTETLPSVENSQKEAVGWVMLTTLMSLYTSCVQWLDTKPAGLSSRLLPTSDLLVVQAFAVFFAVTVGCPAVLNLRANVVPTLMLVFVFFHGVVLSQIAWFNHLVYDNVPNIRRRHAPVVSVVIHFLNAYLYTMMVGSVVTIFQLPSYQHVIAVLLCEMFSLIGLEYAVVVLNQIVNLQALIRQQPSCIGLLGMDIALFAIAYFFLTSVLTYLGGVFNLGFALFNHTVLLVALNHREYYRYHLAYKREITNDLSVYSITGLDVYIHKSVTRMATFFEFTLQPIFSSVLSSLVSLISSSSPTTTNSKKSKKKPV